MTTSRRPRSRKTTKTTEETAIVRRQIEDDESANIEIRINNPDELVYRSVFALISAIVDALTGGKK